MRVSLVKVLAKFTKGNYAHSVKLRNLHLADRLHTKGVMQPHAS